MKKLLILFILLTTLGYAQVAKVVALKGNANIQRGNKTIELKLNTPILKNDIIKTQSGAKLQIIFQDETIITIGKNSNFAVNDYVFDEKNSEYKAEFGLLKGTFRTITGKIGKLSPKKFKLKSKSSSIGIRGTQILSNVQISGDTIFCTEGQIQVVSQLTGEVIVVNQGEYVTIKEGEPMVVQKFDVKAIQETDADTKFINEEEKESALEKFGVTIEESTQTDETDTKEETTTDETNETDNTTTSEVNEVSSQVNDTTTQDDVATQVASDISLSGREILYTTNSRTPTTSTFSGESTDIKTSGADFPVTLIFNDLKSNYIKDGSYSGTLSVSGSNTDFYGFGNFKSGTYTSQKDTSSGFDNNDDVQWGSWNVTTSDTPLNGFWIVGQQTVASEVQALINKNITATYTGYTLGSYTDGSSTGNLSASNSSINLTFNFGTAQLNHITGSFTLPTFTKGETNTINISAGSGSISTTGFSFEFSEDTNNAKGAQGNFYGSNANSIGGNFKVEETSKNITYTGVFKGTKQ